MPKKQVSKHLKSGRFIQIQKQSKKPKTDFKGDDWNKKLLNYEKINELLVEGWNAGLVAGEGIFLVDCDKQELAEYCNEFLPKTYTEGTTSGGMHFIFKTKDKIDNSVVKSNGQEMGEIRAYRQFVVTAPSIAINKQGELKPYEVIKDLPLAEITQEDIDKLKSVFSETKTAKTGKLTQELLDRVEKDTELTSLFYGDMGEFSSRSEAELSLVSKLVARDFTKKEIFEIMPHTKIVGRGDENKWATSPLGYRNLTFEKAVMLVTEGKKNTEELEQMKVHSFKDLMEYAPEPQSWLVENQIPKSEIGFLVGKRGEKKTWTALKQAICLASQKECFNDSVPEKKRVLIIDEESGTNTMAQRFQLLSKGMEVQNEELEIKIISFGGLKLDKKDTHKFQQFKQIVDEFKPDLIIVDCLQRVCSFEVDKDNAAISAMFTETIRPFITFYGMSWLFIHHLRKSPNGNYKSEDPLDDVRGGSELVNYARFVLQCSTPKHQNKGEDNSELLVFQVLKMSNASIPEAKVLNFAPESSDLENNTSIKIDYAGTTDEVLATEARVANAIKKWLFDNHITSTFRTKQVTEATQEIGFKKTFISKGLNQLWEDGFLVKEKRGIWRISIGEQQETFPEEEVIEKKNPKFKEEFS